MARMTGLQAYQRTLKLLIEDAERELDEQEWIALRETLRIGLGMYFTNELDPRADDPLASRKAPSPTR